MKFNLNMAQTPTRAVPEIGNTNAGFDFPPLFLNGARCVIWKHVEHGTASLAAGLPETAGKNQNLNCGGWGYRQDTPSGVRGSRARLIPHPSLSSGQIQNRPGRV